MRPLRASFIAPILILLFIVASVTLVTTTTNGGHGWTTYSGSTTSSLIDSSKPLAPTTHRPLLHSSESYGTYWTTLAQWQTWKHPVDSSSGTTPSPVVVSAPPTPVAAPATTVPASSTTTVIPSPPTSTTPPVTVPPATPTPQVTSGDPTPYQVAIWSHVNQCEESGNWSVDGATYSGGLGFSHANWAQFNTFGFPADAAEATPTQQITVAVAFAEAYLGGPDGNPEPSLSACGGGY